MEWNSSVAIELKLILKYLVIYFPYSDWIRLIMFDKMAVRIGIVNALELSYS